MEKAWKERGKSVERAWKEREKRNDFLGLEVTNKL